MDRAQFARNIDATLVWLKAGAPHVSIGDREDVGFNMENFVLDLDDGKPVDAAQNECGTTCCIAGHVALIHGVCEEIHRVRIDRLAESPVAQFLGLSEDEAHILFYPPASDNSPDHYNNITPAQAAHVIERAIETGIVSWEGI